VRSLLSFTVPAAAQAVEPPGPTGPAGPAEPEPPFPTDPTEPDPAHPTDPGYQSLVEAPDAAVVLSSCLPTRWK
jgi:hypothetical protein